MIKFLDTNILLEKEYLNTFKESNEKFLISSESLKELEAIKTSQNKDSVAKFKARQAVRFLESNRYLYSAVVVTQHHYDILVEFNLPVTPDNLILACIKDYGDCELVSNDLLCNIVAEDILGLHVGKIEIKDRDEYTGFKSVVLNDDELAEFYSNMDVNTFGCLVNEYLVIKNVVGEAIDRYKWTGERFEGLSYKQINNAYVGKIKPRNLEQELAFDLLQDDKTKIKVLRGKAGAGKDYLMASTALDLICRRKFDKIIWIRNNVEVKYSKPIGFLPGTKIDKLKPFVMPFADHVGGEDGLDMLISQGKVVVEHFGTIRGRDFKNSIIICSEAENMTREHIQLLISRIAEGSELWINGDIKQVDDNVFENNNGLVAVVNKLMGNPLFGCVELQKTERSKVAELANLLD